MQLGGIQKISFVDYPGKIAAVCFTVGCNLRCRYCYNNAFVVPEKIEEHKHECIAEEDVLQFLRQRKGFLDGVVICGGEPLMQQDLLPFIQKVKQLGFSVKLDTNGFLPKKFKELLGSGLIDYVAMDIKYDLAKISTLLLSKQKTAPFLESLEMIRTSGLPYELRTTMIKGYHTLEMMEEMLTLIKGAPRYVLQNFFVTSSMVDPDFDGQPFTAQELEEFASLVRPYVGECIVRS